VKILGIDTSTKFLCLGIYDNGRVYEYNLEAGTRLSDLLMPTIKRILDNLGWNACDIDYFACGLGPGSFTGLRVGMSAVKGMAWTVRKPVIGVPTLDTIANNAPNRDGIIMPVIDAKRNLVYSGIYKVKDGIPERAAPYMLLGIDELLKKIKTKIFRGKQNNIFICGDGINLYKEKILGNFSGVSLMDKDCWYPKGHNIIKLALEKIKEKKIGNPFNIKPVYLYPKECQIRKHEK
jgi:tRNA threonylcarbamoyladenosine biosynthesis protein TsaB